MKKLVDFEALGVYNTKLNEKLGSIYAKKEEISDAVADKATTSYVDTKVANLVNSAPETLDTLGELATALEENQDVIDTLNSAITNKADRSELNDFVDLTSEQTVSGLKSFNDLILVPNSNGTMGISNVSLGGPNASSIRRTLFGYNVYGGHDVTAVGYMANGSNQSTAFGSSASADYDFATAIGCSSRASGRSAVSLGYGSQAKATNSIQIGNGTNSNADTFQVFKYQLLDAEGKIPNERLNITFDTATTEEIDSLFT